tara:strand:+ start:325 stop:489 length:165 start_codon:yes stop_codon:yes gene_type:complete
LLVLFRFDMRIAQYWAGIMSGFGELLSLFDLGRDQSAIYCTQMLASSALIDLLL